MNRPHPTSSSPTAGNNPGRQEVRRLRLWPALIIVLLQLALMYGPALLLELKAEPAAEPGGEVVEESFVDNPQVVLLGKALGPLAGAALLLLWWVGFSRASWQSRIIAPLAVVGVGWACMKLMHETMWLGFLLYTIPSATAAGLLTLYLLRRMPFPRRGLIALSTVAALFVLWTLVRLDGVDGNLTADLSWRWSPTPEQRLLAGRQDAGAGPGVSTTAGEAIADAAWPGFRGPQRDGRVTGTTIRSDWGPDGLPELWRRQVGPGWSSFSVAGGRIFTQEQRGDHEAVVAYDARTGEELWGHEDEGRFFEFISGVGPRATPTYADGRLYTTGPSGIINCLDAATGAVLWRRSIVEDTDAGVPMWGFASSPLVHDGVVVVHGGAGGGKSLVAYGAEDGRVVWNAGNGRLSYSSAHLATLHDVPQILMMTEIGVESFAPQSGEQLWVHEWSLGGGSARVVQPSVIGNDVVIATGYGYGTRRISIAFDGAAWSTDELWASRALKPYFNDFVVDGDHAFGFDGNIFTCIDLRTGNRIWKRGRYGSGQVLMLTDQKLLLVLSEKGELVLLAADPKDHKELHRYQALGGKTWNHPVIADGQLFVRNGTEAASFDLRPTRG